MKAHEMNIELRNIKHAAFASEETECFTATVYIDGKRAGEARNDGHGGQTFIYPHDLAEKLEAYAATLPDECYTWKDANGVHSLLIPQSADLIIDNLLQKALATKQIKALLKTRFIFVVDDRLMQTQPLSADVLKKTIANPSVMIKDFDTSARILNTMPLSDAVDIYLSH